MRHGARTNKLTAAVIVVSAATTGSAQADTINVPDSGNGILTIQDGIDVAVNGDEVVVAQGSYADQVRLNGKAITLRSTDPTDPTVVAQTIIDGQGLSPAILCFDGETFETVIDGLTITQAIRGMLISQASATVRRCVFVNNGDAGEGGGLQVSASTVRLEYCTFQSNWTDQGGAIVFGGGPNNIGKSYIRECSFVSNDAIEGAAVWISQDAVFINCVFQSNVSEETGGAVYLSSAVPEPPELRFTNCSFQDNHADLGGVLYSEFETSVQMVNCLLADNSAALGGGGIYGIRSSAELTNCTIVNNWAFVAGGGLFNEDFSTVRVTNCVLWGNEPEQIYDWVSRTTVEYSDVQGGWTGTGNTLVSPQFVDADGPDDDPATWQDNDYRLSIDSPCIDSAFTNALPGDDVDLNDNGITCERLPWDLDGGPRYMDAPAIADTGCGSLVVVDMGAYEFSGETFEIVFGDTNGDGSVNTDDFLDVLANWGDNGCEDADVNGDSIVNTDDFLAVLAAWGPCP